MRVGLAVAWGEGVMVAGTLWRAERCTAPRDLTVETRGPQVSWFCRRHEAAVGRGFPGRAGHGLRWYLLMTKSSLSRVDGSMALTAREMRLSSLRAAQRPWAMPFTSPVSGSR